MDDGIRGEYSGVAMRENWRRRYPMFERRRGRRLTTWMKGQDEMMCPYIWRGESRAGKVRKPVRRLVPFGVGAELGGQSQFDSAD